MCLGRWGREVYAGLWSELASFVSCQSHQYRPRLLGRSQNYRPVALSTGGLGLGSEGVYMFWAQWSLIIECYGNFSFMDHLGTLNQRPNLILDLGLGQETWTGLTISLNRALEFCLTAWEGHLLKGTGLRKDHRVPGEKVTWTEEVWQRQIKQQGSERSGVSRDALIPFPCPLPPRPLPQRML